MHPIAIRTMQFDVPSDEDFDPVCVAGSSVLSYTHLATSLYVAHLEPFFVKSLRRVIDRIGEAALARWDHAAEAPEGWIVDADRRIAGWRDLFATAQGRILIVTSNGAARFALLADEGLQRQASALPTLKLRTGAYGVIERDGHGLRLAAWDQRP